MSQTLTIPDPDLTQLAPQAESILRKAMTLEVTDQPSMDAALQEDAAAAALAKLIESAFKKVKDPLNAAKDAVLEMERAAKEPTVQARKTIKEKILTWNRIATAAAEKAAQEATERAKRQAEDLRLEQAQRLASQGKQAQAEALISRPVVAPSVKAEVPVLKGAGVTKGKKGRVVDVLACLRWVLANPNHISLLAVDPKELQKLVNANVIPDGVEVEETETLVNRRSA